MIKKLSVVIAAYNEKGNIEILLERLIKSLNNLKINYEIILIIDGNDGSYESLKNIVSKKDYGFVKLFYSKKLRGFGNSFKFGFTKVSKQTTHILTMDSDLNHRPEEIKNFIIAMENKKADIVIGSRYISGGNIDKRSFIKEVVSRAANVFFPKILGLKVKDISSGYRLYKIEVINDCLKRLQTQSFEFLAEILYRSKKYKMIEIPIHFEKRLYGESKFRLFKTAKGYFKMLFLKK